MNYARAVWLRLLATVLFALMGLCVRKAALDGAAVGQTVFWRSFMAIPPILLYMAWRRSLPRALKTRNPAGHALRSGFGCFSMFLGFTALAHLPLTLATALSFLAPLMSVPAAMVLLGEKPRSSVVALTALGFGGVALMLLSPAPETGFSPVETPQGVLIGVLAGLAGAGFTVMAMIQVRDLTRTESPSTIAFYFSAFCALAGAATALRGDWPSFDGPTLWWLMAAGILGGMAQISMTEALARAPVSALAAFEYVAMIWALGFDVFVFGQVPGWMKLLGAAVIVAAAASAGALNARARAGAVDSSGRTH
ncbi:DMT family transporter [Neomegalonema perideroedes]|uniref:DMT family transporter n=1 Tax=Neomegalonema perideroedes TaxID=217219 RepID=UPI000376764E|nr:DMT family transporter [Neomegalonema perideroedes]